MSRFYEHARTEVVVRCGRFDWLLEVVVTGGKYDWLIGIRDERLEWLLKGVRDGRLDCLAVREVRLDWLLSVGGGRCYLS